MNTSCHAVPVPTGIERVRKYYFRAFRTASYVLLSGTFQKSAFNKAFACIEMIAIYSRAIKNFFREHHMPKNLQSSFCDCGALRLYDDTLNFPPICVNVSYCKLELELDLDFGKCHVYIFRKGAIIGFILTRRLNNFLTLPRNEDN